VIVVHSPDPKLFEQAIFILKDGQRDVSNEALLREAGQLVNFSTGRKKKTITGSGLLWACGGAMVTAVMWLLSIWI